MLMLALLIGLSSCQKDDTSPIRDETSSTAPNDSLGTQQLKSTYVSILNARNPNQIPSQMFAVNPIYKTAYYHYKQPDGSSCSWTSYVNCINTIVTAKRNYCYPTPINIVRQRCTYTYPGASRYGASHILALEWYAAKYDQNHINYLRRSSTNRWESTKYMLDQINKYHTPFVVRSSMSSIGHYRVVFSISWQQSESKSIVYYTDCWYANAGSFNANLRSMNLYDFLNAMKVNADCYNMLFMWPS